LRDLASSVGKRDTDGPVLGTDVAEGSREGPADIVGAEEVDGSNEGPAETVGAEEVEGSNEGLLVGNPEGISLGAVECPFDGEELGILDGR